MTLSSLRSAVDAKVAILWTRIVAHEEAFFAVHGRYHQFLWTHSIAPNTRTADASEVETAPDTINVRPSNESEGWESVPNFPLTLACRLKVDAYVSPDGPGYMGTIQIRHNGTVYERSRNEGPLLDWTTPWHVFTGPSGA